MAIDNQARLDFERAIFKAFWRKMISRLTGENNDLLPYDEVRRRLPLKGQHYLGLRQVPIDKIIGSEGRYRDFDRAFLPKHAKTMDRWISIDKAHLYEENLPAVELYKMGDIYFVKDGNHRVSVARERGQEFIDAVVIEIDIPVALTPETGMNDLQIKQEYAEFIEKTELNSLRPEVTEAKMVTSISGQYQKLLDHIDVHRWYLGEQRHAEVPYTDAVISWYDNVYSPLVEALHSQNILNDFPGFSEVDLYLWVMDYQWYLRETYRDEEVIEEDEKEVKQEAVRQLTGEHPLPAVKKLANVLRNADWLDDLIICQDRLVFYTQTNLLSLRPEAELNTRVPGLYERLLEHIRVHRWYLGEQRHAEVSFQEAAVSWYDNVYSPLVHIIREQGILEEFPGRTETDLYLWIIEHQGTLRETYGDDVSLEEAAELFAEEHAGQSRK